MKNNIMKKWVKALRSGKFKQGVGTLKQFNNKEQAQHCCLGVLCELYNEEMKKNHKKTIPVKTVKGSYDYSFGFVRFGNSTDMLPEKVRKWAGMKSDNGKFADGNGFNDNLTYVNDCGRKFKTIADIIEKNWENL
jgi:hypothetical protein